jgi:large subunit ribosomal protein L28
MSRTCGILGSGVQTGNNISHSHRKTRRRFLPNLQNVSLYSDALGQIMQLRIANKTLRSVEINGGLDSFLLSTASSKLTDEAVKLKNKIKKKTA